jgi:hypothetical protein
MNTRWLLGSILAALSLAPWGCGTEADAPPTSTFGGTGGTGAGPGTGGGGLVIEAGEDGLNPDAACKFLEKKANATPLHLYVMLDKSSSMVGTKWNAATAGIQTFVEEEDSSGISVGLKFFPRPPDTTPACDQFAYAVPSVPFGVLTAHAPAIVAGLAAEQPDGFGTPVYPALGGAILKGIEIARDNPGHTASVLLVTDGEASGPPGPCAGVDPEDPNEIAKLAATGAAFSPPVLTYVIGLPGANQAFVNQLAQAGGTKSAILVGTTDIQGEFETALEQVRGQALPCERELPEEIKGGTIDLRNVKVVLTRSDGAIEEIHRTDNCDANPGWYYDDDQNPTLLILCPSVCASVKADFRAKLEIHFGCRVS